MESQDQFIRILTEFNWMRMQNPKDWKKSWEDGKYDEYANTMYLLDHIILDPVKLNHVTGCTYKMFMDFLHKIITKILLIPERPLFFEDDLSADLENKSRMHVRHVLLMAFMRTIGGGSDFLSIMPNVDQSTASRYLAFILPVLLDMLPSAHNLFTEMHKNPDTASRLLPDGKLLIDAILTPVEQPRDAEWPYEEYSGTNKKHHYTTLILANTDGIIIGSSLPAKTNSYDMVLDSFKPELDGLINSLDKKPKNLRIYSKRFVRINRMFPGIVESRTNSRGGPLNGREIALNKRTNQILIEIEQAIQRMQHFGVTRKPYDDTIQELNFDMQIVTGLVNLNMAYQHKKYQWLLDL